MFLGTKKVACLTLSKPLDRFILIVSLPYSTPKRMHTPPTYPLTTDTPTLTPVYAPPITTSMSLRMLWKVLWIDSVASLLIPYLRR